MTDNYYTLRNDTLRNCREYRRRMVEARKVAKVGCTDPLSGNYWQRSAMDWYHRLLKEQLLLVALRQRGPVGYRQQVIENWNKEAPDA